MHCARLYFDTKDRKLRRSLIGGRSACLDAKSVYFVWAIISTKLDFIICKSIKVEGNLAFMFLWLSSSSCVAGPSLICSCLFWRSELPISIWCNHVLLILGTKPKSSTSSFSLSLITLVLSKTVTFITCVYCLLGHFGWVAKERLSEVGNSVTVVNIFGPAALSM